MNLPRFYSIPLEGEQAVADRLVSLLKTGDADAIVRGQVYYTNYHEALKREYGFKRDLMCPCLIRDLRGNEWFITPVVHHDDATVEGRCYLAMQAAKICAKLGIKPVVGVLAADSEKGYLPAVDGSLDDAAAITATIGATGYDARIYPLLIDRAAAECNIVVPMDGIVGNFICRSLVYLGGATMVGGFGLTPRFVSIDTSRSQDDYVKAIEGAVAMCNLGGMPVDEYDNPA